MSQEAQVREFECGLRIVHDGFGRRPASWSPPCPENDNAHANFRSFISLHCRRSSRQVRFGQSSLPDDAAVAGSTLHCVRDTRCATAFSLDRTLRTSSDLPVALKCRSCLPCAVGQITGISPRVPCPWIEGRFAIVTERWERNAMDALAACDERGRGGRRSRVVLISRR